MYNKLFTKILDSSIWLESAPTRLVWLTMLAAMDQDGFVQFASVGNLAHRARVSLEEAEGAVTCLESADQNSSDPDNEGRRIERVPGGWMILNSAKYKDLVTAVVIREQTRLRVARHREKKDGNAHVTPRKRKVTPSNTDPHSDPNPNPKLLAKTSKSVGTEEEILSYCLEQGLTQDDGRYLFHKWDGNGWKVGRQSIKDWRATIRSWKHGGYMPSQKNGNNGRKPHAGEYPESIPLPPIDD